VGGGGFGGGCWGVFFGGGGGWCWWCVGGVGPVNGVGKEVPWDKTPETFFSEENLNGIFDE